MLKARIHPAQRRGLLAVALLALSPAGTAVRAQDKSAAPADAAAPAPKKSTAIFSEATLRALWIKELPTPTGGTSPFTVRVSESTGADAAVGFIEHVLGSSGGAWKSSAWIAAQTASTIANNLLTDHEFLLKVQGFIDGPSAGMVMATTMVALIRREEIRPGVSISGTINPDGTIGPVSGIKYKLDGAVRAGVKELGYPMIAEGDEAAFKKEMDDLGKAKGIRMVPVEDIYDAYELMTGRKLGRYQPLDPAEMALSKGRLEWLETATAKAAEDAMARVDVCEKKYLATAGKLTAAEKKDYAGDKELTEGYIAQSDEAKGASPMLAYNFASLAEQNVRITEKKLEWLQAFKKKDGKALSALYVNQYDTVEKMLAETAAELHATLSSPTLAGRMASFSSYLQYWGVRSQFMAIEAGREDIKRRQLVLEQARTGKLKMTNAQQAAATNELGDVMLRATLRLSLLEGRLAGTRGYIGVYFDDSTAPAPDQATLNKRLASAYGPAAAAGLAYFETTVLGESGNLPGGDPSAAESRANVFASDQAFATCSMAAAYAVQHLDDRDAPDDSPEAVMHRLACGVTAWLSMSSLMNRYYNLADYRKTGTAEALPGISPKQAETVNRMIRNSRQRVLEEATRVKQQIKFIPDSIKMSFALGESKQNESSVTAKLDALTSYWRAHFLCKMAQMMAKGK